MTTKKSLKKKISKLENQLIESTELRLRSEDRSIILAETLILMADTIDSISAQFAVKSLDELAANVRKVVAKAAAQAVDDLEKTIVASS